MAASLGDSDHLSAALDFAVDGFEGIRKSQRHGFAIAPTVRWRPAERRIETGS